MNSQWFAKEKDKEKVKRDWVVSKPIRERLSEMLHERKRTSRVTDYELAAWPYYRADADGYNRALTEVLALIKED